MRRIKIGRLLLFMALVVSGLAVGLVLATSRSAIPLLIGASVGFLSLVLLLAGRAVKGNDG